MPTKFSELFFPFSKAKNFYLNIVKTQFLRSLFTVLWTLLLIVPGIVKSYEYRMIPYILAENPSISSKRAFELSKKMTDGEKMNIFVLDLSFIGWSLLGLLACASAPILSSLILRRPMRSSMKPCGPKRSTQALPMRPSFAISGTKSIPSENGSVFGT